MLQHISIAHLKINYDSVPIYFQIIITNLSCHFETDLIIMTLQNRFNNSKSHLSQLFKFRCNFSNFVATFHQAFCKNTTEGRDKSKIVSEMISTMKNFIESLRIELVILIIVRVASYSLQDLMSVKLSFRFLNKVANERSAYQKVTLVSILPEPRWTMNQEAISFVNICIESVNLEVLFIKA